MESLDVAFESTLQFSLISKASNLFQLVTWIDDSSMKISLNLEALRTLLSKHRRYARFVT